jgi:hypothetical protein
MCSHPRTFLATMLPFCRSPLCLHLAASKIPYPAQVSAALCFAETFKAHDPSAPGCCDFCILVFGNRQTRDIRSIGQHDICGQERFKIRVCCKKVCRT